MRKNEKSANADSITQNIFNLLKHKDLFEDYVDYFFKKLEIEELLRMMGASNKRMRHKPVDILKYLIKITATNRSIYQDYHDGFNQNSFGYKTVMRFLNRRDINWIELTTMLGFAIFNTLYDPNLGKPVFFVFDDTNYPRPYANYCEGVSVQHDHNAHQPFRGYRLCLLSVYWNGYSIPLSAVLVSTREKEKMIYYNPVSNPTREESLRDSLLQLKASQVMQTQIRIAQAAGFNMVRYLLFDSWYTHPRIVDEAHGLGLEVIGMLKTYGRTRFRYNGKFYNLKELFEFLKPKTLPFQVEVDIVVKQQNKEIYSFPAALIFNENKYPGREFFCLLSSSTGFPIEQVNAFFAHRWSIEQGFKDLKNRNLSLVLSNRSLSLTGMSAYISVVLLRYMVIFSEREHLHMKDKRSIQEQYHQTAKEITAIDYANTYFDGIRSGLEQISQDFNLDLDDVLKSFSEGSGKSESFAKETDYIAEATTNLNNND